jgi:D-glycero-D-manno-heptose 1,7-bisphosphate phosphatase
VWVDLSHSSDTRVKDDHTRRAVFLDRDGTINVEKNYLHKIEDFEFIPGAPEAIKKLKKQVSS